MKKILITFTYIIAILFIFQSCSEEYASENQIGTIIGKVVTSDSNTPLANVKIETSPISTTVFTDEKGNFVLKDVNIGDYSIKAELKGYTTSFKGAIVYEGKQSNVVFEMNTTRNNNKPPTKPILLSPTKNEEIRSAIATFKWRSKDPDNDVLNYTLTLHNDRDEDVEIFEKITDTTFTHQNLRLGVKYFWQISVSDEVNPAVQSDISNFKVYFAPKNNRILYTKNIAGNLVIFSSNEDGTEEFQLTSATTNSFRPHKNITTNKIAYFRTNGTYTDLYIMDSDGTNQKKLTSTIKPNGFNLNEINFSWPTNSNEIYFPYFNKLYSINVNSLDTRQIYQTTTDSFISEVDINIEKDIVVLKTNNATGYMVNIFCINLQGTFLYPILTNNPGAASGLQIANSGQQILYSLDTESAQNIEYRRINSKIFVYDKPTNKHIEISADKIMGTNDLEPRFSPNEAYVIFTNTSNDERSPKNIYFKELNNTLKTRKLMLKNSFMPDWN